MTLNYTLYYSSHHNFDIVLFAYENKKGSYRSTNSTYQDNMCIKKKLCDINNIPTNKSSQTNNKILNSK